ncbi:MAG: helix-turn-helix transcriptional regulator [Gemmataceae bacterium]
MTEAIDLYDPRVGSEAMRIRSLDLERDLYQPARTNRFGVYRIASGQGRVAADATIHPFAGECLLFLVPYQYIRFEVEVPIVGDVLEFHANFLCIETFHAEVGCAGRLFSDPYRVPVLPLSPDASAEVADLFARIRREHEHRELAHEEAALAYLKVLLILASRLKSADGTTCGVEASAHRHPLLADLTTLIEQRYREWHAPSQYADALHVTAKTLGRIVREHLGTTLSDLIRNRVLTHAKWQLLHTLRPVKEVAAELGFADELYFSRLFKKATGLSPTYFREFETAIRGGSNLSMSFSHPSIPTSASPTQNAGIESASPGIAVAKADRNARRRSGHERAKAI